MKFHAIIELSGKTATGIAVPTEVVAHLGSCSRSKEPRRPRHDNDASRRLLAHSERDASSAEWHMRVAFAPSLKRALPLDREHMDEYVQPKTLTQQQEKASGRDAFYRPGASCRDVSATQHVLLFSMSLLVDMTVERASRPPSFSMLSVKKAG
jgi:hypothetical protein